MVYLADHPALAALEVRVHLDLPFDLLPDDHVLLRVPLGGLPEPVALDATPRDPREAGAAWLRAARAPLLRVPSALVPRAWNLLLNPALAPPGFAAVEAIPFRFDERLWAGVPYARP